MAGDRDLSPLSLPVCTRNFCYAIKKTPSLNPCKVKKRKRKGRRGGDGEDAQRRDGSGFGVHDPGYSGQRSSAEDLENALKSVNRSATQVGEAVVGDVSGTVDSARKGPGDVDESFMQPVRPVIASPGAQFIRVKDKLRPKFFSIANASRAAKYPPPVDCKDEVLSEYKIILDNINFIAKAGEITVIMGPSGSGKTTLLNALAGRIKSRGKKTFLGGDITFGGIQLGEEVALISSYVMQRDKLPEYLTVQELLTVNCALKLKGFDRQQRQKRVDEVIEDLNLSKCRNSIIGGGREKGLSGGEMKRVSIAVELLENPQVIFLDEPTSGLDAALAFDVLSLLSNVARNGNRTVICTAHQPRSQSFTAFDKIVLLNKGEVVYQGRPQKMIEYFSSLGYTCPSQFNPADFALDILTAPSQASTSQAPPDDTANKGSAAGVAAPHDAAGSKNDTESDGCADGKTRNGGGEQKQFSDYGPNTTSSDESLQGSGDGSSGSGEATLHCLVGDKKVDGDGSNVSADDRKGDGEKPPNDAKAGSHPPSTGDETTDTPRKPVAARVVASASEVEKFPKIFSLSAHGKKVIREIRMTSSENESLSAVEASVNEQIIARKGSWYDWFKQVAYLVYATFLDSMRNPAIFLAASVVNIVMGSIFGGIFWNLSESESDVSARSVCGAVFFYTINYVFSCFPALLRVASEREMVNRNLASHTYSPSAYFVAKSIADFPFLHIPPNFFTIIAYWMTGQFLLIIAGVGSTRAVLGLSIIAGVGGAWALLGLSIAVGMGRRSCVCLAATADQFFVFVLITQLDILAAVSYFLLVSCAAPSPAVAQQIAPLFIITIMLMAGFYLNDAQIPAWISWLRYLSFIRFGYSASVKNQFRIGDTWGQISNEKVILPHIAGVSMSLSIWEDIAILFALGIGYRIVAYFFLRFTNRNIGLQT